MIKAVALDTRQTTSKGQKIIAALFLVTEHLPEQDPFRGKVRTLAMSLLDVSTNQRVATSALIQTLLGSAVIAKLINEKNAEILHMELGLFVQLLSAEQASIGELFPGLDTDKGHIGQKRTLDTEMSFILNKKHSVVQYSHQGIDKDIALKSKENKSIRHEKILSYINTRKSANIKDISLLFPDVSEKTIQRELGWLVASGKITKRGDKRWSLYLALS